MRTFQLVLIATLIAQAYTVPAPSYAIDDSQDVLLFDGVAFQLKTDTLIKQVTVELQSFTFQRDIDVGPLNTSVSETLASLGVNFTNDQLTTALDRLRLFAAVPNAENVPVSVGRCNLLLSDPVNGTALRNISLCDRTTSKLPNNVLATVPTSDNRQINATLFSSSSTSGFGVISDIDDTIKITNVLNPLELLQTTLFDTPEPVAGMPELYTSIAKSLDASPFIYVSASPFEIYPFLHDFVHTTFAASKGPIFLRNLTVTSLNLESIISVSLDEIFDYKNAMIDRIKGLYPDKRFLAVGDSTQRDPETYGQAFRKYGDFIACAWIHAVDGANNTAGRFAAAFEGVPTNRYRIYNDSEIPDLQNIDIAAGDC